MVILRFFLLVFFVCILTAQDKYFERFKALDELSKNTIYNISQDSIGFIWIASDAGVFRYDGNELLHIDDEIQSESKTAYSVQIDEFARIWKVSSSGLSYLDNSYDYRFKRFNIAKSREKKLFANQKLFISDSLLFAYIFNDLALLNLKSGVYKTIRLQDDLNHVESFFKFSNDKILITRNKGINVFDLKKESLSESEDFKFFKTMRVIKLLSLSKDSLLIASKNKLFVYDKSKKKIHNLFRKGELKVRYIHDIILDKENLWIGTSSGIFKCALQKKEIKKYANEGDDLGTFDKVVYTLFKDRSSSIWAGTSQNGLKKLNLSKAKFKHYKRRNYGKKGLLNNTVWSFAEDSHKQIWIATENGISIFDPNKSSFRSSENFSGKKYGKDSKTFISILGHQKYIYAALYERGIFALKQSTGDYRFILKEKSLLNSDFVRVLKADQNGRVWIGSDNGINSFDPVNNEFKRYFYSSDSTKIAKYLISSIDFDRHNRVWFGTTASGVVGFNPRKKDTIFLNYNTHAKNLASDIVYTTYVDQNDRIFIGTDKGYSVYKQDSKGYLKLSDRERLSDHKIFGIVQDNFQNYWFSSHDGVFRFNKNLKELIQFNVSDGLQNLEFNQNAIFKSKDGKIYFGGVNGFNIVDPSVLKINSKKPSLIVSSLKVNARRIGYAGDKTIKLNSDTRTVEISVSLLNFVHKGNNSFRYKLSNYQDEWSDANSNNSFLFRNLGYGEFYFTVEGINARGIKAKEALNLKLIIQAPFYKTLPAIVLFAFIILLLFTLIHKMRTRSLISRRDELEGMVKERTHDLEERKNQLEQINTFSTAINKETNFRNLVEVILKETKLIPSIQKSSCIAFDKKRNEFRFIASLGWNYDELRNVKFSTDEVDRWATKNSEELMKDVLLVKDVLNKEEQNEQPKSSLIIRIVFEGKIDAYFLYDNMDTIEAFDNVDPLLIENMREHIYSAFLKTRMLEKLTELNQLKNEFLGIAVHDIRSPLSHIFGLAEIINLELEQDPINRAQILELSGKITSSAKRLNEMITTLLDIAAIESGKLKLSYTETDIGTIVKEVIEINKSKSLDKKINIHFLDCSITFRFDKNRIFEAIDNLLSNAIKYTNLGGEVKINLEDKTDLVYVHISDSGLGLSQENIKRILNYQKAIGVKPTAGEKSTGFGLAIVRKIIDEHNGHFWLKSDVNKGSTFSFSLPK